VTSLNRPDYWTADVDTPALHSSPSRVKPGHVLMSIDANVTLSECQMSIVDLLHLHDHVDANVQSFASPDERD